MFKDFRKRKLYILIEQSPGQYSSDELGEKLSISPRTVRKEMKDINEMNEENGFFIRNQRGKGYYIDVVNQKKYHHFRESKTDNPLYFDVNDKQERMKQFILQLLNIDEYAPVGEIADDMYVSRTTIMNELDDVREWLSQYQLELKSKVGKGIYVDGLEKDKRFALLSIIDHELNDRKIQRFFEWKDAGDYLDELKHYLPFLLTKYHLYFTDENLHNLIYHIMIMMERIRAHFAMEPMSIAPLSEDESSLMQDIKCNLEGLFEQTIPENEMKYLYVQIKSKMISKMDGNHQLNINTGAYIDSLLQVINKNYLYDLSKDVQLRNDLSSHIYSMLYRAENQIRVRNPMEEHIKKYYPLAYEITLYAVESIKNKYKYEINRAEIAYLALHIGASLERNYQVKYQRHNSCLIVCGSGFGTARVIESSIKQTMPNLYITNTISAQKYDQLDYIEEDCVITTVKIDKKNKPVYPIETLPSKRELLDLDRKITNEVNNSIDIFSSYFSNKLFLKGSYKNKKDIIHLLVDSLEKEAVITDKTEFINSIMKREEMGSTVIGEGVSIPHPLNLLANRTKIAIAVLDEPVEWTEGQYTQLVFLLAISKKDYEQALGIYDFLVEIVRENKYTSLTTVKNYHDFILKARMLFVEDD